MIRPTIAHSLLWLATACGEKAGGASSGASTSAAPATSSAASPAKPKGKAGSAVAVVGKKTYQVEFDVGYVDRFSEHAAIVLFADCPSMTCDDVGSHKDWVKKCPKGKKVSVQSDGVKDTEAIPTGALAKPKVWVRWMPDPDHQDDLFFDTRIRNNEVGHHDGRWQALHRVRGRPRGHVLDGAGRRLLEG